MPEHAVVIDRVSKGFRMYHERNQSLKAAIMRGHRSKFEEFFALRDVSAEIPKGVTYGLIGENGSGKSTLLKCIARILQPDSGTVTTNGSLAALLELGSGFHPELSGRENVFLNASILGMRRADIEAAFDKIVDFAGIGEFIDQPVKNYSSGMYVRLGFSVAINVDPDVLLVDEVLAVGDSNFQDKCMEKFAEFRRRKKTVIIVSHAMSTMRTMCDEVTWLEHGRVVETGAASKLVDGYLDSTHMDRNNPLNNGERWGSGEVQITKIEILDHEGQPTTKVRTGEAVTFRLSFKASERIEEPVFGLSLKTVDGVRFWAHNSKFSSFEPPYIDGCGIAELSVPRLMLQPGTFDLMVSALDHTAFHVFDFRRDSMRFDVLSGEPTESGGIMALGGTWSGRVDDDTAEWRSS